MPFARVWASYNLASFEEQKQYNEGRFPPAVLSYILINMFKAPDAAPIDFEKHCNDTIGMIPLKRKMRINKVTEVDKSNKTMDMFLNNTDWG